VTANLDFGQKKECKGGKLGTPSPSRKAQTLYYKVGWRPIVSVPTPSASHVVSKEAATSAPPIGAYSLGELGEPAVSSCLRGFDDVAWKRIVSPKGN